MNIAIPSIRKGLKHYVARSLAATVLLAALCLAEIKAMAVSVVVFNPSIQGNTFSFSVTASEHSIWTVSATSDWETWTDLGSIEIPDPGSPDPTNAPLIAVPGFIRTFSDPTIPGVAHRFYFLHRVVDNKIEHSQAIGFVRVTAVPGSTQISDPLLASPNNSLTTVLAPSSLPSGTQVSKWNGSGFDVYSWNGTSWSPNGNATLAPGEGAFIRNNGTSPFTVTFLGIVPEGNFNKTLPIGYSMVGALGPIAGRITSDLGYVPNEADMVVPFDSALQDYSPNCMYDGGIWTDLATGEPLEPSIQVGQGFFLWSANASWHWTFSFFVMDHYP